MLSAKTLTIGTSFIHLYFTLFPTPNKHLLALTKCAPIALLTAQLYKKSPYFTLGMSLSLLGDLFLAYHDQYPIYFVYGLGSFLLAHVSYIVGFIKSKYNTKTNFDYKSFLAVFGLVGGLMSTLIVPHVEPKLKVPVMVYGATIAGMIWKAYDTSSTVSSGITGAMFFGASDFWLAYSKFVLKEPSAFFVMTTYYLAQGFITKLTCDIYVPGFGLRFQILSDDTVVENEDHVIVFTKDLSIANKYPNMHYLNDYKELADLILEMTTVPAGTDVYDKTFGDYLNSEWFDHLNYFIRDEHECLVMMDGLGSMANIILASEEELQNCSLSKEQARSIQELFK
ncbi:hypothetical protein HDV06_003896 [Boothiomyces sp. JEL0866]|nr:hypothetical protein HDV06_003896 [Boothiomyces sp. JEL0866]